MAAAINFLCNSVVFIQPTCLKTLVRATRSGRAGAAEFVKDLVQWGAGPRASQFLIRGAKALDEGLHIRQSPADSKPKARFPFLPIGQIERNLDRPARVQSRADFAGCRDG